MESLSPTTTTPTKSTSTTSQSTNKDGCYVLYVDHQGHPAPIEESYHATATRCLSSAIINRGYPSTVRAVDSAYCPQCFTVYTEIGQYATTTTSQPSLSSSSSSNSNNSNNNMIGYYCTKASCKLCPICLSIASVQLVKGNSITSDDDDNTSTVMALYQCGNCDWSSDQCRLVTPIVPSSSSTFENTNEVVDNESFGRIEFARASNELITTFYQMKNTFDEIYHQYWIQVTNSWIEETTRRSTLSSSSSSNRITNNNTSVPRMDGSGNRSSSSRVDRIRGEGSTTDHSPNNRMNRSFFTNVKSKPWSIESLEESLQKKKKRLSIQLRMMKTSQGIQLEDDDADDEDDECNDNTTSSMSLQNRKGLQIQRISVKSISAIEVNDTPPNEDINNNITIPYVSYIHQLLNTPFVDKATSTITTTATTADSMVSNQEQEIISSTTTGGDDDDDDVTKTTTTTTLSSSSSFLPLLVPLRLRTSRRCRKEMNEGRPGILLKPKLNPLEGDSSLRTGQGQWYKKDCSAIAIVPRLDIVNWSIRSSSDDDNNNSTQQIVLLLKVSNPTLGTVRLRLATSQYNGEPVLFPEETIPNNNTTTTTTRMLHDLVVDTVSSELPTIVHAKVVVVSSSVQSRDSTVCICSETVELLSAEDSIIELGTIRPREVPTNVTNWIPPPLSSSTTPETATTSIRFIGQNASDAWFEYIVVTNNDDTNNTTITADVRFAIPIALQVEIGNGSWESSLIPPKTTTTTTTTTTSSSSSSSSLDFVTFDIVLVV